MKKQYHTILSESQRSMILIREVECEVQAATIKRITIQTHQTKEDRK